MFDDPDLLLFMLHNNLLLELFKTTVTNVNCDLLCFIRQTIMTILDIGMF